jgi:hypothetical protein
MSYTCRCSLGDLEEHHRRHKYDMGYEAERCITSRINTKRWNKVAEDARREEEEHELDMERQRQERQQQQRDEEEAHWEAQQEQEEHNG